MGVLVGIVTSQFIDVKNISPLTVYSFRRRPVPELLLHLVFPHRHALYHIFVYFTYHLILLLLRLLFEEVARLSVVVAALVLRDHARVLIVGLYLLAERVHII